jgi:uncharacterized membrane protein YiaA
MKGYMKIARGSNMCQVASENYYLTVTISNTTTNTTTKNTAVSKTTTVEINGQIVNNINNSLLFGLLLISVLLKSF